LTDTFLPEYTPHVNFYVHFSFLFIELGHATWTGSMDKQLGNAACRMDSKMDVYDGYA
jgi:hypothetical protein